MKSGQLCSLLLALVVFMVSPAVAQFTQQGSKLVGTGVGLQPFQGNSVSVSADGNTAIVGGPHENSSQGAAWVFTRSGGVWTQQGTKLVGTGAVGNAQQGYSVSISGDGNTALVGGISDNGGVGAAWVYTRSGGVWTQQGNKLVGTGAIGSSFQGFSVSLSADGNTAIEGGYEDSSFAGAAWVYTRSGGVWSQQGNKLYGTSAVGNARQGLSVSLSADGNTAMVGGTDDNSNLGAAWVYTRSAGVWSQQGNKLVGTGASGIARQGSSVSLSADGNTAIVGGQSDNSSAGAAWVFTRSGGVWTQQGNKLVGTGGPGSQGFSVSMSSDGNTAIVGGYNDGSAGAVWEYTRMDGVWIQQGNKLVGTGGVGAQAQGYSVSISADGNTFFVGGINDNSGIGAAWVYARETNQHFESVLDIPHDQGGVVRLKWSKFLFDSAGLPTEITSYAIWRKIRPGNNAAAHKRLVPPPTMSLLNDSLSNYDFLMSVPAVQIPTYNVVAPTLQDSSATGAPYFTYLITGQTPNAYNYYVSAPDSGYSVDNLAPIPPAGIVASVQAGPHVQVSWNPPTDPDVGSYFVYRSTTDGFTPAPGNKIGSSYSTDFTDTNPLAGDLAYYRIVAVDVHDNQSQPSPEVSAGVTVSQQFSLQNNWNIVSVPLKVSDFTKTTLYPTASSPAFAYNGAYVNTSSLANGAGYWVKFSGAQSANLTGLLLRNDTITVQEGWNIVGSLSQAIAVSSISSIPGGIVTSRFFGYQGGYSHADSIRQGQGYWVKVAAGGQLVLSSAGNTPSSSRIRMEDRGENPPSPPEGLTSALPGAYSLGQNYPNPFNPGTTIRYSLPVSEHVKLSIYNILGQEVATLVNESQDAGYKSVSFDARGLPSGMYSYKLTAGTFTNVKKLLLVR